MTGPNDWTGHGSSQGYGPGVVANAKSAKGIPSTGCDNGRCGGGSGGSEHRLHFPAVDSARWDEANVGSSDQDSRWSQGATEHVAASDNNTMASPQRGQISGARLDRDRGGFK